MTDSELLSGQMLDRLTGSGELAQAWLEAFAAVTRYLFIPDGIPPVSTSEPPECPGGSSGETR